MTYPKWMGHNPWVPQGATIVMVRQASSGNWEAFLTCLHGWAAVSMERRLKKVEAARKLVPLLSEKEKVEAEIYLAQILK